MGIFLRAAPLALLFLVYVNDMPLQLAVKHCCLLQLENADLCLLST